MFFFIFCHTFRDSRDLKNGLNIFDDLRYSKVHSSILGASVRRRHRAGVASASGWADEAVKSDCCMGGYTGYTGYTHKIYQDSSKYMVQNSKYIKIHQNTVNMVIKKEMCCNRLIDI